MRRLSVCERESYKDLACRAGHQEDSRLRPGAISPPSPCPPISNFVPGAAPDVDHGQTVLRRTLTACPDTKGTPGMHDWGRLLFPSSELARCHCEHPAVNPVTLGVSLLWVQTGLGQDWVPGWAEWC